MKLVVECIKDVINQFKGERWFTKNDFYIAEAKENTLYAINNKANNHSIALSEGQLWHTDEWFIEHFIVDMEKTDLLNKNGKVTVERTLCINEEPITASEPSGRMMFKYNEDDILELLAERIAESNGYGTFRSRAILFGKSNDDLRLLCVVGNLDDDEVDNINLEELDKSMDFNGTHE